MRIVTVVTAIVAAASLAGTAACSSSTSGAGSGSGSPVAPTTASAAPSTPSALPSSAPVSSPPASSASSTHVPNEVDAVLLTPAEVGTGFVKAEPNPPGPLPCEPNEPPVTDQVKNTEMADAVSVNATAKLQFEETVYVYSGVTDAIRHQQIDEKGLSCAQGTESDGSKIALSGPTNVAADLTTHTDKAEAWSASATGIQGALVLVRIHAVIVEFSFLAATGTTPPNNEKQLIDKALAKIINGG